MPTPADDRPVSASRASTGSDASGTDRAAWSLLNRVQTELGADPYVDDSPSADTTVPLPSRLATGELALASVGATMLAAGRSPREVDPRRVAVAYRSDRFLAIEGAAPSVWSPFSGFWRTADGWIRTHGNYPHHADALCGALRLTSDAGADDMRVSLAARTTVEAVADITKTGGLAVPVSSEDPARDRTLRGRPLLDIRDFDDMVAPPQRSATGVPSALPLAGTRVLDLTRVIAGPVCTRTLALLGADVLRIDPPHLAEPEWQHLDTGHGKRSALLDARTARMHDLLSRADAVVLGYRPSALRRLGLDPDELADRYPGLVVAQLSAWGIEQPDRAGFDSLVQAESGIALVESVDGSTPGVLPAQALDHSAGYLLAAAVTTLLERHTRDGGTRHVRTSLRRVAAELLGMPRRREPQTETEFDVAPHLARFDVSGRTLVTSRPALTGFEFAAPHRWGVNQPTW